MKELAVLIADDHADVRDALKDILSEEPDLRVVATARDATEAIVLADRFLPDVAVLDVNMPGGGGWVAARELLLRWPQIRLIAYSANDGSLVLRTIYAAGFNTFVSKSADLEVLLAAVRGEFIPHVSNPGRPILDQVRRQKATVPASRYR